MKKQKRSEAKPVAQAPAQTQKAARWWSIAWWYWAVFLGALFLAFEAYGPALRGPFVLDDLYLPYADVNAPVHHLSDWVSLPAAAADVQLLGGLSDRRRAIRPCITRPMFCCISFCRSW